MRVHHTGLSDLYNSCTLVFTVQFSSSPFNVIPHSIFTPSCELKVIQHMEYKARHVPNYRLQEVTKREQNSQVFVLVTFPTSLS
jgi:hypothetical protein